MAEPANTLASAVQPKSQASIVQRCEVSSLSAQRVIDAFASVHSPTHANLTMLQYAAIKYKTTCQQPADDMQALEYKTTCQQPDDNVIVPYKSRMEVAFGSCCVSGFSDAALELFNADEPGPLRNRRHSLPSAEGVHQAIQVRTGSDGRYLHMIPDVNQKEIKASTWQSKGDLKRKGAFIAASAPSCSIPDPEQSKRHKVDETIRIMDVHFLEESDSEMEKQPEVSQTLLRRWSRDDSL